MVLQGSVAGHKILFAVADAAVVLAISYFARIARQIRPGECRSRRGAVGVEKFVSILNKLLLDAPLSLIDDDHPLQGHGSITGGVTFGATGA